MSAISNNSHMNKAHTQHLGWSDGIPRNAWMPGSSNWRLRLMVAAWSCAELQMCERNKFHLMPCHKPVLTGAPFESRMILTVLEDSILSASKSNASQHARELLVHSNAQLLPA